MKIPFINPRHHGGAGLLGRLGLLLLALLPLPALSQDTSPGTVAVYPASAFAPGDFVSNSGAYNYDSGLNKQLLSITTHFGAIPNDSTKASANTKAFRDAFDFIKERQQFYSNGDNCEAPSAQWIIYVPNGTYYVNDTLSYRGTAYTYFRGVRLIGQSRANTIIKLVDNASGFNNAASPKAVIAFDSPSSTFNNWQGHNMLKNIKIDVGSGNAGAVGVDFFSPNSGRIDNVFIYSQGGTNQWAGAIGLRFRIGIVHGYISNVTISGFDVGISLEPYHMCHPTLENITLNNQKFAAIKAVDGGASMRHINSTQNRAGAADAAGIVIDSASSTSAGSHLTVIDSNFASTRTPASSHPAINLVGNGGLTGFLFARNVTTSGYTERVLKDNNVELTTSGTNIAEYVSDRKFRFSSTFPSENVSMGMTIEETPSIASNTAVNSDWITAGVGDGATDDTDAIQTAMDSGKPVIYFPKQKYRIDGMINVPESVKRIELMATAFVGSPTAYFNVDKTSTDPLLISDLNDAPAALVRLSSNRTLVLDSNRQSNVRNNGTTGQNIFVNNGNKFLKVAGTSTALSNMNAWCRFVNTEDKANANWTVNAGGVMWVLGYKCEGPTINFQVNPGGILEVLGGIANQYTQNSADWDFNDDPHPYDAPVVNIDGHITYVGYTNGPPSPSAPYFENLVGTTQGGTTKMISTSSPNVPFREGRPNQFAMPLYNAYDPAVIP